EEDDRLEPLRDLAVGGEHRFQEVLPALAGADPGQVLPDLAALAFRPVAAEAIHLDPLVEDLPAARGVAAREALGASCCRILPCQRRVPAGEFLAQSRADLLSGAGT